MRLLSWLRPLVARRNRNPAHTRRAPQRPTFRPRLEALEDRLTPSGGGLLDPTFGSGGIVNLPSTTNNGATAVAVQPDGKVVIAGLVARSNGYDSISVQRLNRDGSLDTTFNKTGSVKIQTGNDDTPRAVALQPDGKILVGGGWSSSNGTGGGLVARLNRDGSLDTTFGSNKGLWLSTAAGTVTKLAVLTDPAHPTAVTSIIAADNASANGVGCFGAVKLTPAGQLDKTFGSGGVAVIANLTAADELRVASVAVAPSGEIYLAGHIHGSGFLPDGCVAALTPAGALDTTFGGGAGYVLAVPPGTQDSEFYDLAVQTLIVNGQPVSRLIVAGSIATPNNTGFVAAYTLGGTIDTTFGSGGSFTYTNPPVENSSSNFRALALEPDGSIVVGGYDDYTAADGSGGPEMLVGHLTADGAADTSFGPNGTGFTGVQDGRESLVWGLAIDPSDGSIVASGFTYSTIHSLRQAAVARLTAP